MSQFLTEGSQGRNFKQGRNWSRAHGETLLPGLLPMTGSVCPLIPLRTTHPGVQCGNAPNGLDSPISVMSQENAPWIHLLMGNLMEAFLNLGSSFHITLVCVKLSKHSSEHQVFYKAVGAPVSDSVLISMNWVMMESREILIEVISQHARVHFAQPNSRLSWSLTNPCTNVYQLKYTSFSSFETTLYSSVWP